MIILRKFVNFVNNYDVEASTMRALGRKKKHVSHFRKRVRKDSHHSTVNTSLPDASPQQMQVSEQNDGFQDLTKFLQSYKKRLFLGETIKKFPVVESKTVKGKQTGE